MPVGHIFLSLLLGFLVTNSDAYITYIEKRFPLEGTPSPPGSPWPMPQKWNKTETIRTLDPVSFEISSNARECDIIDEALVRYRNLIFIDKKNGKAENGVPKLPGLTIRVKEYLGKEHCGYPKHQQNEEYELRVPANGEASIDSHTVWGALRGLETFSQLIYQNTAGGYLINVTSIRDWPRFGYRGVLLDTARHFQPKKILKQNLEAMAYNKFNVFHWHLVDDQSFPFESKKFPDLAKNGAYTPRHIYTQKDIKEIIEFARLRGIRVIPEIDTPGHTQGFAKTYPDLITPCYGKDGKPFTPNYNEHADSEILNPIQNSTYDFFKEFFQEIKDVFVDEYIHLGMDEVYYACWKSNPNITKFMKDNNMTEISQVEDYYVKRTLKNVKDIGYKYMIWQDPIDNGVKVSEDSIIHMWKDTYLVKEMDIWQNYIRNVTKYKYQIVLDACWYLNYISYGMDWKKYYQCDPRDFNGTEEEQELVIGGQACMWGEYVDGTNLIARLWPRASAVAERLWSDASVNNTEDAQYRLDEQRCRMVRRRIPAQPILNGYCGDYDWDLDADWPEA